MKHLTRSSLFLLVAAVIGNVSLPSRTLADTTLQAKLVPAITISGPLGSLQQVQYTTNPGDSNSWAVLSQVRLDTPAKAFYDQTASDSAKRFYRTKMIGIADTNLVWIPPGTFLMGSPTNEQGRTAGEGPQTLVTLTKGFLMGRFEVRYVDWLVYSNVVQAGDSSLTNYLNRAVRGVQWSFATNYCNTRTLDEQQRGLIPPGWMYRLPTEAEWEYACRAGSTTPFGIGSGLELRNDDVRHDAAFSGNLPYPTNLVAINPSGSSVDPFPVGVYTPNGFGLYDMHGNAAELTWDYLGATLPGGTATNPVGTLTDPLNGNQPARGGSFADAGSNCRSASRRIVPVSRVGFRVVLIPAEN